MKFRSDLVKLDCPRRHLQKNVKFGVLLYLRSLVSFGACLGGVDRKHPTKYLNSKNIKILSQVRQGRTRGAGDGGSAGNHSRLAFFEEPLRSVSS